MQVLHNQLFLAILLIRLFFPILNILILKLKFISSFFKVHLNLTNVFFFLPEISTVC